jgi:uncharacterized membrane protein
VCFLPLSLNRAEQLLSNRYTRAFMKATEVYKEAMALGILGWTILLDSPLRLSSKETYSALLESGSVILKNVGHER